MKKLVAEMGKAVLRLLPDKQYLEAKYRYIFGKHLDLENPQSYSEKLQWLKLYDRDSRYSAMVDKIAVKPLVEQLIGSEHIIKTIAYWDKPEDIEWDKLPNKFVLKTAHGGGMEGVLICRDKSTFDIGRAIKKLNKAYSQDLYKVNREWPYKMVPKRILAEEYMEDEFGELRDYKFFCFDGVVRALFVATERTKREEPFFNFFDENYKPLPMKQGHPVAPKIPLKPKCFDEMKEIAGVLSKGYPHVRVDLYEINGKVYFGEYTFYHFGGMVPFEPEEWDYKFGCWLQLPNKN